MSESETPKKLNPRWLRWLEVNGFTNDFDPTTTIEGLKATYHFAEWIRKKWMEWAKLKGFNSPEHALMNGFSYEDFDQWLNENKETKPVKVEH